LWQEYLATIIQLDFAVFMACLPFYKNFIKDMANGGLFSALIRPPTHGSNTVKESRKSIKFGSFFTSSTSRKNSTPGNSIRLESICQPPVPMIPRDAEISQSNTHISLATSDRNLITPFNDKIQFIIDSPKPNSLRQRETFRPDNVATINHIRHSPLDEEMELEVRRDIEKDKSRIRSTTQ
jgi:hypothetical protein